MELYFLRHGIAVEHGAPGYEHNDDARPLTAEGRQEARQVATTLKSLIKPDLILTSPLPRARQTADIVGEILDVQVVETPLLGLNFSRARLAEALEGVAKTQGAKEFKQIILVGHEPTMSQTVGELVGARLNMTLKKTGLVRVDVADRRLGEGTLRWLLTPGHMKRMKP